MLYKLEIPIPDYDKDEVFMQPIYFEGEHDPSREEVLEIVWRHHDERLEDKEYDGYWIDCAASINSADGFPDKDNPFVACQTANGLYGFIMLYYPEVHRLCNA